MLTDRIDRLDVPSAVRAALQDVAAGVRRLYGSRLVHLVLFGSQARGEAHAESDADVLVVLRGSFDIYEEVKRTSPLVMEALLKHQISVSLLRLPEHTFNDPQHPLMINVNEEGIALSAS